MHAPRPPRSSRRLYLRFVEDYRHGRLDAADEPVPDGAPAPAPAANAAPPDAAVPPTAAAAGAAPAAAARFLNPGRRQYLREYLRWLQPHRYAVGLVFLLALAAAGLQMIEPLFMRYIIDSVLLEETLDDAARLGRLHLAGFLFLAVVVVSNVIGAVKDYRQRLLNMGVMLTLRRSLFDRMLHLPLARLHDMKTGGILSRLTGDIDTTTGLLQLAVISPSISVIRLLIAGVVLFTLNWRLALTAIAIIPGVILLSLTFAKRVRPIYRSVRKDAERIDGRVGETFSGIRVVRGFRREMLELLDYMRGRHTVLRKEMFAQRRELVLWTTWSLLLAMINVAIIWYGGWLNIRGGASIGDIMAFQWYTFLLLNPVWNIVNSFSELQRSLAAMERVFEVLGLENEQAGPTGRARRAPRGARAPLRPRRLRVPRGYARRARPRRHGAGGYGRGARRPERRRQDDHHRPRRAVPRPDARTPAAERHRHPRAARRANAHEFIEKLPDAYDTFVGERGVKLSGGQQQRLAIARAFLAAPQILVLDEATSKLDTESEQLIQSSMATLLAGRTTFVIAHRLSTVRRADMILLLDDGRVIEQGTHDQLMRAGGVYRDMVIRQLESDRRGEAPISAPVAGDSR